MSLRTKTSLYLSVLFTLVLTVGLFQNCGDSDMGGLVRLGNEGSTQSGSGDPVNSQSDGKKVTVQYTPGKEGDTVAIDFTLANPAANDLTLQWSIQGEEGSNLDVFGELEGEVVIGQGSLIGRVLVNTSPDYPNINDAAFTFDYAIADLEDSGSIELVIQDGDYCSEDLIPVVSSTTLTPVCLAEGTQSGIATVSYSTGTTCQACVHARSRINNGLLQTRAYSGSANGCSDSCENFASCDSGWVDGDKAFCTDDNGTISIRSYATSILMPADIEAQVSRTAN